MAVFNFKGFTKLLSRPHVPLGLESPGLVHARSFLVLVELLRKIISENNNLLFLYRPNADGVDLFQIYKYAHSN